VKVLGEETLIPQFVQLFYAAQSAVSSGDRAAATNAYRGLLAVYRQIHSSQLAKPHKDLAHQQVTAVYNSVSGMTKVSVPKTPAVQRNILTNAATTPITPKTPARNILTNAPITPTSPPQTPTQTNILTNAPATTPHPPIPAEPEPIQGPGNTRILGLQPKDFVVMGFFAALILLVMFFKPAYIGLAVYEDFNSAPEWIGVTSEFQMAEGQQLSIDFATAFKDADGDQLIYLSTETEGLKATLGGSTVTFTAVSKGVHSIVIMASDLKDITKVPVTVTVT